jgi:hypothetical protein
MLVFLYGEGIEPSHNVTKLPTITFESSIQRASLGLPGKDVKELPQE